MQAAFCYHFSLNEDLSEVPGRRLAPSCWRHEYTLRHSLTQRWMKSKLPTTTHDPRVGNVSMIFASLALPRPPSPADMSTPSGRQAAAEQLRNGSTPSLLSISVSRGIASKSDPFSGKVAKGGLINALSQPFAGLGANEGPFTCAAISKDGEILAWCA